MHTDEWKKSWKLPKIIHNELTKFNYIVAYPENLTLGKYFDIGAFSYLQASHGIIIEDNVEIGGGCHIYSESTIDDKKGTVTLKKNCKIGAHSVILPGIVINENSVIGACSLVKKNVPKDVIAFGVPCKIIRSLRRDEINK